jgi:hypothetical protein
LSDAKKLNHLHVDAQLSERAETGATQIDAVRYVLSIICLVTYILRLDRRCINEQCSSA